MNNFNDFDEFNDSFDHLLLNSNEPEDELSSNYEENFDGLVVIQDNDELDNDDEKTDNNEIDGINWRGDITQKAEYNLLATEICDEAYNISEPVNFCEQCLGFVI